MVHNGYLNENTSINTNQTNSKSSVLQCHQNMNADNYSLLQLMTSDPIVPSSLDQSAFTSLDEDSALMSTMQAQRYNVLKFNNKCNKPGQENKAPSSNQ